MSCHAGIGATRPPEMIDAADDAAVWLMLFSRLPHCRPASRHSPNHNSPAAMDMLNAQPIFRQPYTLQGVSRAPSSKPDRIARTVSSGEGGGAREDGRARGEEGRW